MLQSASTVRRVARAFRPGRGAFETDGRRSRTRWRGRQYESPCLVVCFLPTKCNPSTSAPSCRVARRRRTPRTTPHDVERSPPPVVAQAFRRRGRGVIETGGRRSRARFADDRTSSRFACLKCDASNVGSVVPGASAPATGATRDAARRFSAPVSVAARAFRRRGRGEAARRTASPPGAPRFRFGGAQTQ